jgi:DNA-binding transcriptional LysR family regulator
MENLVSPPFLDLKTVKSTVRIACVDNAAYMLFQNLLESVLREAPNLTLQIVFIPKNPFESLKNREIDFFVTPMKSMPESGFHSLALGTNRYVLLGGRKHPLLEKAGSGGAADEEISRFPFIDIIVGENSARPKTLREWTYPAWKDFRSSLRTVYFLPFVQMIEDNNLLIVLPEKTAEKLQSRYRVRIIPTRTQSVENDPHLIWHETTHSDPLHQWVRSVIQDSVKKC